jgi:hypothetical protein
MLVPSTHIPPVKTAICSPRLSQTFIVQIALWRRRGERITRREPVWPNPSTQTGEGQAEVRVLVGRD